MGNRYMKVNTNRQICIGRQTDRQIGRATDRQNDGQKNQKETKRQKKAKKVKKTQMTYREKERKKSSINPFTCAQISVDFVFN